jgi:multidrug efflux pump subunit AcrA (membrane-fusion protein)
VKYIKVVALVALSGSLLATGCAKSPEEQELKKSGDKVEIVLEGVIEPSHEAKIVAQLSDKLKMVTVKNGSRVKQDQVIAEYFGDELHHSYRKAQLEYERAALAGRPMRGVSRPGKESLANAKERMLSTFELYRRDQASLAEVKGAEEAYLSLQRSEKDWVSSQSNEAAQAALTRAEASKDAQRARLEVERARQNYAQSRIVAPIAGYVTSLKAYPGQSTSQGEVLGSIMDIDQVNLKGSFSPGIYPYLKKGMQLEVSCLTTPPYNTKGVIQDIAPVIDAETKRMRLDIPLGNSKYLLQPGDKCVINIVVTQKEAAAAGLPAGEKKVVIRSETK